MKERPILFSGAKTQTRRIAPEIISVRIERLNDISNYSGSLGKSYTDETLNLSRAAYAVADAMLKARENNND